MKSKKQLFKLLIVAITCGVIAFVISTSQRVAENRELRIGVLSFLTGIFSEMGQDLVNGAEVAIDTTLSYDRFATNSISVKLFIEDGKVAAKTTVDGFNRMVLNGLSAAVVAGDTPVPAAAPLIKRTKIPTVATIVSTSGFLDSKSPWIFRDYVSVSDAATFMAEYCINKLRIDNIPILFMRSEYGEEGSSAFAASIIGKGGKVNFKDTFLPDAKDARSIVAKVVESKAQAVCVLGYGAGYNVVINQLREAGYSGYILTDEPVASPGSKTSIKDFTKIIFTSQDSPSTDHYRSFSVEYRKRFNKEPSLYADYGFDSVWILIQAACMTEGDVSSEAIQKVLLSGCTFKTLRGEIKFKENGDCVLPIVMNEMNRDGTYCHVE